jgi:outer membrane protein assembly factor BamB
LRRVVVLLVLSLYLLSLGPSQSPVSANRFFAGPLGSTDYPWTMFHHDALRSGATPASAPNGPNLMWSFTTGSNVYPSPVVTDGMVFIPSYDGNLYALDEYSGAQRWVFYTSAPIYATPAVVNGVVYLASKDTALYAIDEQTGSLLWKRVNISPITSSPVVADGKVFYGTWFKTSASALMALNANNGTVAWQYLEANDTIKSSPAVYNGRVFFGQNTGIVVALNETTGKALWGRSVGPVTSISTAPAVALGRVFVGADTGTFVAIDQVTGSISWSFGIGAYNSTSAAVNNGVVYFGTAQGIFYARNATTGNPIWTYPSSGTIGAVMSSPAIALGSKTILFGSADSNLYALNMTTGMLLWKYAAGGAVSSSPAIADGRAFFGSWDTKVYALGVIAPTLQVSISASRTSLRTGQISSLTVTITNGTAQEPGVSLAPSSAAGGSFTTPVMTSPGTYRFNFTAPSVNTSTSTSIQVVASKPGFLNGSAQTAIALNPLPTLTVTAGPKTVTVSPGGTIILVIQVANGSIPIVGANINLTSSAGGGFSSLKDTGNGNYSAVFNAPMQSSSATVTIQASKPGFIPGQNQVTVTVSEAPSLTGVTVAGIPVLFLIGALALGVVAVVGVMMTRRKKEPKIQTPTVPNYVFRPRFWEGLSNRFRAGLFTGLAAIAGS